jgi:hypothetical protein
VDHEFVIDNGLKIGRTLDSILDHLTSLQKEIQHLKSTQLSIEAHYDKTKKEITSLNQMLSHMKQKQINSVTIVAFSAFAEADQAVNNTDTLRFTGITTNIGGHYNASTGEFTCPYHGIYNFNIVILTSIDYNMRIGVYKDTSLLIRIYSNNCFLY